MAYKPLQDPRDRIKHSCGHLSPTGPPDHAFRRLCRQCSRPAPPLTERRLPGYKRTPTQSSISNISLTNKSETHNGRTPERPQRPVECEQLNKCGDDFARELSHVIDAILEEHGKSLQQVISNINLSRPSVSPPGRTFDGLTQRSSVLPSLAERLNVGSAGRIGPNINDCPAMLREAVQTVPGLIKLINSTADNLGIDLDRRPSLHDDELFWDSPLESTPPTPVLPRQRLAFDGTADEIDEEQQRIDDPWLRQTRRQLTELSRKSTALMGELDTIADDLGVQVPERYAAEPVGDPVEQVLGEVSTGLSTLFTRLRDTALDVTPGAPPRDLDMRESPVRLHRVMMRISLQSRRKLAEGERSQEAEERAPEEIQEWIEVAQLHLPLGIDSSTITAVLETVPTTSASQIPDPVEEQVASSTLIAKKAGSKSATSFDRLDTEELGKEHFPDINEPTKDVELQHHIQDVEQTTNAPPETFNIPKLTNEVLEQRPVISRTSEQISAQRTENLGPRPEAEDDFDALVMRIARVLTQPSYKQSTMFSSTPQSELRAGVQTSEPEDQDVDQDIAVRHKSGRSLSEVTPSPEPILRKSTTRKTTGASSSPEPTTRMNTLRRSTEQVSHLPSSGYVLSRQPTTRRVTTRGPLEPLTEPTLPSAIERVASFTAIGLETGSETEAEVSDVSSLVSLAVNVCSVVQEPLLPATRQVSGLTVSTEPQLMILSKTESVPSGPVSSRHTSIDKDSPVKLTNTTTRLSTLTHMDSELSGVVQQDFDQTREPIAYVERQVTAVLPVQLAPDPDVPGVDELGDEVQHGQSRVYEESATEQPFGHPLTHRTTAGTDLARQSPPRDDPEVTEAILARQAAHIEQLSSELQRTGMSETSGGAPNDLTSPGTDDGLHRSNTTLEGTLNPVKLQKLVTEAAQALTELARMITQMQSGPQPHGQQGAEVRVQQSDTEPDLQSSQETKEGTHPDIDSAPTTDKLTLDYSVIEQPAPSVNPKSAPSTPEEEGVILGVQREPTGKSSKVARVPTEPLQKVALDRNDQVPESVAVRRSSTGLSVTRDLEPEPESNLPKHRKTRFDPEFSESTPRAPKTLSMEPERPRRVSAAPGIDAPPPDMVQRGLKPTLTGRRHRVKDQHYSPDEQHPPAPAYPSRETPAWTKPDSHTSPVSSETELSERDERGCFGRGTKVKTEPESLEQSPPKPFQDRQSTAPLQDAGPTLSGETSTRSRVDSSSLEHAYPSTRAYTPIAVQKLDSSARAASVYARKDDYDPRLTPLTQAEKQSLSKARTTSLSQRAPSNPILASRKSATGLSSPPRDGTEDEEHPASSSRNDSSEVHSASRQKSFYRVSTRRLSGALPASRSATYLRAGEQANDSQR